MGLFKKPLRHSGEELNGLGMYRGMEVNFRQKPENGITKATRQILMARHRQRINEYAQGYRLGEMLEMGMEGMED